MKIMLLRCGVLLASALALSCSGDPSALSEQTRGNEDSVVVEASRERVRMSPAQLSEAVRAVSGGIGWVDNDGDDLFVENARSLGQADYIEATRSDFTASASFHKVLRDAAEDVCDTWLDAEVAGDTEAATFFTQARLSDTPERNPERVNQNLADLLLGFHGRQVHQDSDELEPWRFLLDTAQQSSGDSLTAWKVVCVGMMVHPSFYTY